MDKDYIKNGERMGREIITGTDLPLGCHGCNASFLKVELTSWKSLKPKKNKTTILTGNVLFGGGRGTKSGQKGLSPLCRIRCSFSCGRSRWQGAPKIQGIALTVKLQSTVGSNQSLLRRVEHAKRALGALFRSSFFIAAVWNNIQL